jgi:hypothetical protein
MEDKKETEQKRLLCRFKSESGEVAGDMMDLPLDCTVQQLTLICNAILQQDDQVPYLFYVNDTEITHTLEKALKHRRRKHRKRCRYCVPAAGSVSGASGDKMHQFHARPRRSRHFREFQS